MYRKMNLVFDQTDGTSVGGSPTSTPSAPAVAPTTAPAPAPSPAPTGEAPVTSSDVDDLFSDIANEDLTGGGEEDVLPVSTPKGVKPSAPATPVPAAAPAPAPAASTPLATPTPTPAPPVATAPAPSPAPATAPAPTPTPTPGPTDEERKAAYEKERTAAIAKITERYSTLSEEDVRQLTVEPEKVLPKLLARVYADAMDNMTSWVHSNLPNMLEGYQANVKAAEAHGNAFFSEWPELNKPELLPAVARILKGYRSANPEAKPEDVVREGGIAALVALKLPIPDRVMTKHNVTTPDATRPAAFPPVAGPGASTPPPKPSDNVFTVIAQEDLAES